MSSEASLKAYFNEARGWDFDRAQQMRRLARLAGFSAVAGWVMAVALACTLAALMPLKSVQPFVVRVDNASGIVDVVPTYVGESRFDVAVTRYLLTRYVRVCEGYLAASAESDYEECGAFHSPERNQEWSARWNPANPASPINLYRDGTTLRVRVTSISFFKRASGVEDLAQVRYVMVRRNGGTGGEQLSHFITTIQYTYARPSNNPKVRQWNPLGLRIMSFRREAEVPNAATQAASMEVVP